jgi:acetyl-CoA C-acetyltransferase
VERAGVPPEDLDIAVMGLVLQAGVGQVPSRQAAVLAGLPIHLPSETINKVCASGMRAVTMADQAIRAGDLRVAVAGGMESMSNAPFLARGARFGYRMGNAELTDALIHDGLLDPFTSRHMGEHNTDVAEECRISREQQDRWAFESHRRAIAAMDEGRLAEQIVPVEVPGRKGTTVTISEDEGPRRDTSLEALAALKPAFGDPGSTTAGNAPGINDGAAAMVVTAESYAEERGLKPLARILSFAYMAQRPEYFPTTPPRAARLALDKAGIAAEEVDLWEVNEAFAAVSAYAARELQVDPEIMNVNGGAVAYGHPIGASGARILLNLALELRRRGGGIGVAAICSGTAQGDAVVLEVPAG